MSGDDIVIPLVWRHTDHIHGNRDPYHHDPGGIQSFLGDFQAALTLFAGPTISLHIILKPFPLISICHKPVCFSCLPNDRFHHAVPKNSLTVHLYVNLRSEGEQKMKGGSLPGGGGRGGDR